ncbi:MAG: 3-hydroxyacyl-ACP dehydratase FabZ [Deltaproteobacteria bacterium]|nr:3-hydroxyacyl-ACP dehydratase FabZ [Deltaproteobacteria bacterium]
MYDIKKIMECLPHRYPFILIDRILDITIGEHVTALKNVTINEHFFQGHFPCAPIMPGVLILETIGQAGAVLAFESFVPERKNSLIYFMGMDKVKFRKPVTPGDQMIIEVKLLKKKTKIVKMAGIAKVDDNIVAEAELMAIIGDKNDT